MCKVRALSMDTLNKGHNPLGLSDSENKAIMIVRH